MVSGLEKRIDLAVTSTADTRGLEKAKARLKELAQAQKSMARDLGLMGLSSSEALKSITKFKSPENLKGLGLHIGKNRAIVDEFTKKIIPATTATKMMIQQAGGLGQMMDKVGLSTKAGRQAMASFNENLDILGVTGFRATNAQKLFEKQVGMGNYKIRKGGQVVDGFSGKVMNMTRVTQNSVRSSMRPFRGEFLSLMFIGMGLSATFGGMIQSVLQLTGIFDAFRGILAAILLPILMPFIAKWLPLLIKKLQDPAFKDFIGRMIIFLAAIGSVMAIIFPFALLFSTLGIKIKDVIGFVTLATSSWGSFLIALIQIAGVVMIVIGAFSIFTGIIKNQLWPVLKGVLIILGTIAFFLGGPVVAIVGAAIALIALFADKLNILRGVALAVGIPLLAIFEAIKGIVGFLTGGGLKSFDFGMTTRAFSGMVEAFKDPFGKPTEGIGNLFANATPTVEQSQSSIISPNQQTINYEPNINVNTGSSAINTDELARMINASLAKDINVRGI